MKAAEAILDVKKKHQIDLLKKNNVNGVGIGYKIREGKKTDELSLVTLVTKKMKLQDIAAADLIPKTIQGVTTDVIEVGEIVAHQSRTSRQRPAPPGTSIGHYNITAGTFGAVVRDRNTGQRLILSNNHVLANVNSGQNGDSILQPGPSDGGRSPQDTIATLDRYVRIQMEGTTEEPGDNGTCSIARFFASSLNIFAKISGSQHRLVAQKIQATDSNLVDAALARPVSNDAISDEIIDIGKVTSTREPELDLQVTKSGRTTGTTVGTITTLNAFVRVNYGGSLYASFEGQILTSAMSNPGDSGSLLVSKADKKAVGLLFAGSDLVTIHSPIQFVMDALQIDFNI